MPEPVEATFVPYTAYREYEPDEMLRRARDFAADMQRRRTVRQFSDRPVPREIIECCVETAGTAPSPLGFLSTLLQRPTNERAIMLLVTDYPAPDARIPSLSRKPMSTIATFR